ncbi:SDR family oxidoreductase [Jiangella endophytica]|uniref:SDR family oxidoreductase n=1 Tax=Jiangella endophytica TaxID=1623398 RepID=UPI000E344AA3|nr:NAD(P)H-binding protein [Jiangella endophytica]
MTTPLLVTGGTGTLGRLIVPRLVADGRTVRVLGRTPREPGDGVEYVAADLRSDDADRAVAGAVDGVDTILHLAGGPKGDAEATQRLARAAARAGVKHLVHISAIGADRVPIGWFRMKLAAEEAVTDSGVPWTILRAAQFHDLVLKTATAMAKLPVIPVPGGMRFQPVDARDVAERLTELTLGEPAGLVADLAGPRVAPMGELLRAYLAAAGRRRALLPVRMPGKAGRAYRGGANLTLDGADLGTRTWAAFLAERLG